MQPAIIRAGDTPPPEFVIAHTRNFCIIAHIDHGKSTLADRLIQLCGGLSEREMKDQVLDTLDLERERGITIKAQCVRLAHTHQEQRYQFNLIDTPGHVDFSYEVSRSLAACEGALLLVDAAQGVEAQSVANCYKALEQGLEVIPVINKMDLPQADVARVKQEIEEIIGIDATDALLVSAKTGAGVDELLTALVERIPAPQEPKDEQLQALIVDSWFDNYLGVVSLIRLYQGEVRIGDSIQVLTTGKKYEVTGVGVFTPKRTEVEVLRAGDVGYLVAGIKELRGAPVGDTVMLASSPVSALPGFSSPSSQVYASIFTVEPDQFESFREALERLSLNDASLVFEPESSEALGFGFRCGFLGMLHMEVIRDRLEREYDLNLIITAPSVPYELVTTQGETRIISRPAELPESNHVQEVREPVAEATMLLPEKYLGNVLQLCIEKRGIQKSLSYLGGQIQLVFELPLSEVVADFFDRLKSVSRGYASLDYHLICYRAEPMVRLDLLIGGDKVDALSLIIHRSQVEATGRELVDKMRAAIPRQMFDVPVQAAVGARILARQTVKALRKNVTAKCYGGDITRKKKLLEKQKKGKKRMRQIGRVQVPQEAFLVALNREGHS